MITSEEREAGGAGVAVGGEEERGVDLEPAGRIGGDIGARDDLDDAGAEAQEEAAALVRMSVGGRLADLIGMDPENLDRHIISVAQWGPARRQSR